MRTDGLGESYAHIRVILFAYFTGTKAYGMPPTKKVGIQKAVKDVDFQRAKRKYKETNEAEPSPATVTDNIILEPSTAEKATFLKNFHVLPNPSAILSVMSSYYFKISNRMKDEESKFLYRDVYEGLLLEELQTVAEVIEIKSKNWDTKKIEEETWKSQAKWMDESLQYFLSTI